jgi:hypothetical protein
MEVSMASMSTASNGLKPEIRLPLSDILLLTVVVEDRLEVEAGEEDLGVFISEFELLKL